MEKRSVNDELADTPLLLLGCHCLVTEQKGMEHAEKRMLDELPDSPHVLLEHPDVEREEIATTTTGERFKENEHRARSASNTNARSFPAPTSSVNIVPEYCWPHVQMDRLLGQGSFSRVFKVHLVERTTTTFQRNDDIPRIHRAVHCTICHLTAPPNKCNEVSETYFFKHGENNEQQEEKPFYYALKCPTAKILEEDDDDDSSSCSSSPYHDDDDDDNNDNNKYGKGKKGEQSSSYSLLLETLKDLSTETKLLSHCCHENIVRLHGIVKLGGYDFPLLELLQRDTLADRITTWRRQLQHQGSRKWRFANPLGWLLIPTSQSNTGRPNVVRNQKGQSPLSKKNKNKKSTSQQDDPMAMLLEERLGSIAIGVAQGMQYLHKNHIVLRDLKPDNIGFALRGGGTHHGNVDGGGTIVPKIFDFGFACNIHDLQQQFQDVVTTGTGGFKVAGTARYMPPEAILGTGVDLTVDVYAFGMVLWELCTLQDLSTGRPNTTNHPNEHIPRDRRRVGGPCKNLIPHFLGRYDRKRDSYNNVSSDDDCYVAKRYLGWQPSVESIRLPRLKRLILECWAFHPSSRPNFGRILKVLKIVVQGAALSRSKPTTSTTSTATIESSHEGRSGRS